MTTRNTRKRGLAFGLVAALATAGVIGGSYAALNQSITDGAETHAIEAEAVGLDFGYKVNSGVIQHDLTPTYEGGGKLTVETLHVENTGNLPANWAFSLDQDAIAASGIDLDNSLLDHTHVYLMVSRGGTDDNGGVAIDDLNDMVGDFDAAGNWADNNQYWTFTARDLLDTAVIADNVIWPGESLQLIVYLQTPDSRFYGVYSDVEDFADDFVIDFGSVFTFNHVIGGTSPLVDYAKDNGTPVGDTGKLFTIPAADLAGITL